MNKQTEILKLFNDRESLTKKEIMNLVPFGYYYNAAKHTGAILSRMVNNGKLKRIKKGLYAIGQGKPEKINPDQIVINM